MAGSGWATAGTAILLIRGIAGIGRAPLPSTGDGVLGHHLHVSAMTCTDTTTTTGANATVEMKRTHGHGRGAALPPPITIGMTVDAGARPPGVGLPLLRVGDTPFAKEEEAYLHPRTEDIGDRYHARRQSGGRHQRKHRTMKIFKIYIYTIRIRV